MATVISPGLIPATRTSSISRSARRPLHPQRFAFIDALRGLAALAVALHHINRYGPLPEAGEAVVPKHVGYVIDNGWIGVQVFFVISGFVIAYSLRDAFATPRFLARFALRRSLRLDPPYWATIGIVLTLSFIAPALCGVPPLSEGITFKQVASHFAYLQNVVGYENLSVGFWTLCIEFQFYLLYVVLLGVAQRLPGGTGGQFETGAWQRLLVFAPFAVLSLFVFHCNPDNVHWLAHFFCMFFLGMLAWWTLSNRTPSWVFWTYVGAMLLRIATADRMTPDEALEYGIPEPWNVLYSCVPTVDLAVALCTGVAIYLTGRANRLGVWLNVPPLQYLGRISYSLYLIHYPISHLITNWGYQLTGDAPLPAVGWLILSVAASIGGAQLLYMAVEAPSVRWAASWKERSAAPAPQPVATTASAPLVVETAAQA
ncbi:MAG TPA: acyltransferase [Planctomycetaceae bacterium]|nr:acyltransferase [Planctomycetaceae bacterium]